MTKLVASLGGGELPTIAYLAEIHTQRMIDSGAITPVQEFIDRDNYDLSDLDEKAVKYYTLDGKLWAMPFAGLSPCFTTTRSPFAKWGSTRRSLPRTWTSCGRPRRRCSSATPTAT